MPSSLAFGQKPGSGVYCGRMVMVRCERLSGEDKTKDSMGVNGNRYDVASSLVFVEPFTTRSGGFGIPVKAGVCNFYFSPDNY
jgi:hypothetical protein